MGHLLEDLGARGIRGCRVREMSFTDVPDAEFFPLNLGGASRILSRPCFQMSVDVERKRVNQFAGSELLGVRGVYIVIEHPRFRDQAKLRACS